MIQIWRGIDLWFQNWHEEFDKFWPELSKVMKGFPLLGSFWAKHILSELRKYRRVIFHNTEFGEKLTCCFKIDKGNLTNFEPEHSKVSKICTLMGSFWPKYIMFELKKYRGVMFDSTEGCCKIWRKVICVFKNDKKNLAIFPSQAEK